MTVRAGLFCGRTSFGVQLRLCALGNRSSVGPIGAAIGGIDGESTDNLLARVNRNAAEFDIDERILGSHLGRRRWGSPQVSLL